MDGVQAVPVGRHHSILQPKPACDTHWTTFAPMSTSSIIGTFNVLEMARTFVAQHLLMASTSAVFGANEKMPFAETDKADTRVTMYAATKKASESIARACAHLWEVPITMFRFFTVYGRWGRPDLAFYKFVDAILDGRPIEVYNHGNMHRDFPYVDDLVRGIRLLIDVVPRLGTKAKRIYKEMEPGDAPATWAGPSLLQARPAIAPKPICGRVSQGSSPGTANTTGNSVVHREAE